MVRDNHDFLTKKDDKTYVVSAPGVSNTSTPWLSPKLRSHRVRLSHQDDPVSTSPISNGVYIHPTKYRRFSSTGYSRPFAFWRSQYHWTGLETHIYHVGEGASSMPISRLDTYGCSPTTHIPAVSQKTISRAESSVLDQINSGNWSMGQSLGELPSTLRMLTNTVARIVSAAKQARKGNLTGAAAILTGGSSPRRVGGNKRPVGSFRRSSAGNRLASNWLTLQYGWMPLYNDIYQGLSYLSNGMQGPDVIVGQSDIKDDDYRLPSLYPGFQGTVSGRVERGCYVRIPFGVSNPQIYDLNNLGLLNPALLAWELLPLSFVFDWFIPVGNFLESLTAGFGTQYAAGSGHRTLYLKNVIDCEYYPQNEGTNGFNVSAVEAYPYVGMRTLSMSRTLYFTLPTPIPSFDANLNFSKVTSLVALLLAMK